LKPAVISSRKVFSPAFLSYYPLKQGLKLAPPTRTNEYVGIFILLSIKTRIETRADIACSTAGGGIFILLSIKTRIETYG